VAILAPEDQPGTQIFCNLKIAHVTQKKAWSQFLRPAVYINDEAYLSDWGAEVPKIHRRPNKHALFI
jgi:hypothetical protein